MIAASITCPTHQLSHLLAAEPNQLPRLDDLPPIGSPAPGNRKPGPAKGLPDVEQMRDGVPVPGPRLDADGFPIWPLFDAQAPQDTLVAVNKALDAPFAVVQQARDAQDAKQPRKRKNKPEPPVAPSLFTFRPSYRHNEFANLPDAAFSCAIVAPNEKIYFIPFNAPAILTYDYKTDETELLTLRNGQARGKYIAAALAPNGSIYCMPFDADDMAIINTQTNEVTLEKIRIGRCKWRGAVTGTDGVIYGAPDLVNAVLAVDTLQNNFINSVASEPPFPSSAYSGACVAGNGQIYFSPLGSLQCACLSVKKPQPKVEFFGAARGDFSYNGIAIAPTGSLFCVPYNADHVLQIFPNKNSVAALQIDREPLAGHAKYVGSVLGPDGNIYCVPHNESRILVIKSDRARPDSKGTLEYWGAGGKAFTQQKYVRGAYHGGVLGPDGRIYFVPWNAKHLLAIGEKNPQNMNRILSPMFNKF